MRNIAIGLSALAVSACASGPAGNTTAARPSIATVPTLEAETPAEVTVRAPENSDVSSVIGEQAGALTRRFGSARIDLSEGPARKLQFAGKSCVLDVYLYPVAAGTEPVATHVEARRRNDGVDVEKAACIAEVAGR